jgi:sodium/potassium-transporting ATPase subunit alpha
VSFGEKVPADIRIISSSDLKVNNASLTGENLDIKLGPDALHEDIYEAKNIARSGCNFVNGSGTGIVFSTGDNTFFGSIA